MGVRIKKYYADCQSKFVLKQMYNFPKLQPMIRNERIKMCKKEVLFFRIKI